MIAAGIDCRLELRLSGRCVLPIGRVLLREDLFEGSALRFDIGIEDNEVPALRDEVALSVATPSSSSDEANLQVSLWVSEVRVHDDGRGRTVSVLAVDPLSFASRGTQFRSWAGRVSLPDLAAAVLAAQPFRPDGAPQPQGSSPCVESDWLLQANESGRDFLARVASAAGAVLYWDRNRFTVGLAGRGPNEERARAEVRFGRGLVRLRKILAPGIDPQRLFWVDPATREVTAVDAGESTSVERRLFRRMAAVHRPESSARLADDRGGPSPRWDAWYLCADLKLGASVGLPGDETAIVARLDHRIGSSGSYLVRAALVPVEAWGLWSRRDRLRCTGPYQAEVSHNDDPLRLGRIRVVLAEDPERRPTAWIPFLCQAAGAERGWHWIPEIGDLVLIASDDDCPEALCVLGGLRGKDREADAAWRSTSNARKVLAARAGLRVLLDEQEERLEIAGKRASIAIERDGTIRLKGVKLDVELDDAGSIRAGGRLSLDGMRIDLGS